MYDPFEDIKTEILIDGRILKRLRDLHNYFTFILSSSSENYIIKSKQGVAHILDLIKDTIDYYTQNNADKILEMKNHEIYTIPIQYCQNEQENHQKLHELLKIIKEICPKIRQEVKE